MSETKFTPGPWQYSAKLSASENHCGFKIWNKSDCWPLADVQPGDANGIEGKANASLIAAAPELYNFVEEYLEAWENGMAGDSYLFYLAQAVRGKARGEA